MGFLAGETTQGELVITGAILLEIESAPLSEDEKMKTRDVKRQPETGSRI